MMIQESERSNRIEKHTHIHTLIDSYASPQMALFIVHKIKGNILKVQKCAFGLGSKMLTIVHMSHVGVLGFDTQSSTDSNFLLIHTLGSSRDDSSSWVPVIPVGDLD